MEEKKICPFMSRIGKYTGTYNCQKEKCMAWVSKKEIPTCTYISGGGFVEGVKIHEAYCKLIDRS